MHQAAFAPSHVFGTQIVTPATTSAVNCSVLPQASAAHHRSTAVPLGAWSSFKTSPSPLLAKVGLKADMGRVC